MTITEIAIWDNRPQFRDGSFIASHAAQTCIYSRILAVTLSDGTIGIGEIVFPPYVPMAQIDARINDEPSFLAALPGHSVNAIDTLVQNFSNRELSWRAVAFGLNTAALDIKARLQGCSVSELLGDRRCESIPDYFSIGEKSIDRVRQRLKNAGTERTVIQLKLGIGSIVDDTAKLQAVLDYAGRHQTILADANGGWTPERALATIARFDDPRIRWEEPCQTYEQNTTIAKRTDAPIMVDQCIAQRNAAIRAVSEGIVDSVCIKPAFLGGLEISREIRDLCAAHNMKMRIDGPFCTDIANAAVLHLASGAPAELLIASSDLREPLVIEPDLRGVKRLPAGTIAPPAGVGLGIEDVRTRLNEPDSLYGMR